MNVSVIIPALNEAELIAQAIASAQKANVHEVIVADGGSTDTTSDIATESGARVIFCQSGRSVQQNAAAKIASGEVLLFLHADSQLPSDAVTSITSALSATEIVAGAFEHQIDQPGSLYRLIERGNALRVRWFDMPYGDQAIFVRRQLFEQINGFPVSSLMEDVLLMRQIRRRGKIVLLPGPLITSARRWQQNGVLRQTLTNWFILAAERCGISPDRLVTFYR